jgi:hypothetical protein
MECILEEVEAEKNLWLWHSGGASSERTIRYGILNTVIKNHVGANPWLTQDSLNNHTNERNFDKSIRICKTGTRFTRVHILHVACSSMQNGAILLWVLNVKS